MKKICIEVVYALPMRQSIVQVRLEPVSSIRHAIAASGILELHPEIDLGDVSVGIWSKPATLDSALSNGDRVEIYRSLIADPKVIRRQMAQEARSRKR